MKSTFSVACGDFVHSQDPEDEWTVTGFETAEAAIQHARRTMRSSVESHRLPGAPAEVVYETWMRFGEYAATEGFSDLEWARHCAEHPSTTPEETDNKALEPR